MGKKRIFFGCKNSFSLLYILRKTFLIDFFLVVSNLLSDYTNWAQNSIMVLEKQKKNGIFPPPLILHATSSGYFNYRACFMTTTTI